MTMAVKVLVTSVIQKAVDGQREFDAEGSTVAELIENITSQYPDFRSQIADENGELHRFVNIYLNDEDIRYLAGKDTAVSSGDTVSFLPALAGGAPALPLVGVNAAPAPPSRARQASTRQYPPRNGAPTPPPHARRAPGRHAPDAPPKRSLYDCGC
jgi:molybdopterin synthase sulfur carrier subunit